jgi:hypothetical protein
MRRKWRTYWYVLNAKLIGADPGEKRLWEQKNELSSLSLQKTEPKKVSKNCSYDIIQFKLLDGPLTD